jgi:hypothetical protein
MRGRSCFKYCPGVSWGCGWKTAGGGGKELWLSVEMETHGTTFLGFFETE